MLNEYLAVAEFFFCISATGYLLKPLTLSCVCRHGVCLVMWRIRMCCQLHDYLRQKVTMTRTWRMAGMTYIVNWLSYTCSRYCNVRPKGHSGSMTTVCPKGRVVHQAKRWRVQFPPLQLPEGCTHGFAVGEPLSSLIRVRGPKKMAQGLGAMNTLWALGSPKGAVSCAVGDWVPWGPFGWTACLTSWLARLSSQWGCVMGCWWSSSVRSPWVDSIPNELMGLAQFLTHKRVWKDRAW